MATEAHNLGENTRPERVTFAHILRNQGFRNLWLGQIVSQIGDYFAFLAMTIIVSGFANDQQGTTLAVAGMMISFSLPRVLFGMIAGVFVDRWDRRRTMIVSDLLRAGLTLALIPTFLTQNLLLMYVLGFLLAAIGTLFNPAKGALIPRLVPEAHLLAANSLSQTSQMLATLIGPALAGATFAAVGNGNQWIAFVIDSASFLVSGFAIWRIAIDGRPERAATEAGAGAANALRQVGRELVVGLRAVALNRIIVTLTVAAAVVMLGIGAINILWIVLLKTRFGYAPAELAWRVSVFDIAFSVGMIIASVFVGNFLAHIAPKWILVVSLLGSGLGFAVFTALPDYWLMSVAMFGIGAFIAPVNTAALTLIQMVTPNQLLGRVMGGLGTVVDAATLISMSLAGVLGTLVGIPMMFLLGGLLCMGGGLLTWAVLPSMKAGPPATVATEAEATTTTTTTTVSANAAPSL
jgi:DHA3 family macrolide efflux protein-like MFS transporter